MNENFTNIFKYDTKKTYEVIFTELSLLKYLSSYFLNKLINKQNRYFITVYLTSIHIYTKRIKL